MLAWHVLSFTLQRTYTWITYQFKVVVRIARIIAA